MAPLLLALLLGTAPRAYWTDGTLQVPGLMEIDRRHDPAFEPTGPLAGAKGHEIGDTINFWSIDYSEDIPRFYLTPATCRYVGNHTYIFVEDSQWGVHYDQDAVSALATALETETPSGPGGIMDKDIEVFGQPPDAIDGDPRVYFLVLNIRDGFDPQQGGVYIAGFFSPYNQFTETEAYLYYGGHSNEVEMLYIDCFPSDQYDAAYTASHELVHLIQWGIEPFSSEELWVIENQAQSGTFVCGYPAFQVETFLEVGGITPIKWTSLTDDIEYVAGYGAGFLFFSYLYENYGGDDFLHSSLRVSDRGVSGVSEAIRNATGETPDMDQVLADWMLACWIDDPGFGDGRYGWDAFRIADYDTVSPGNRAGLDYSRIIESDPFIDTGRRMSSYQGSYYRVDQGVGGSFRADGSGLGDMRAYLFDGSAGILEVLDTGSSNDVALSLPQTGDVLLMCSSFSGLDLDVAAGSVASASDDFAVYPQPCQGTLYMQFLSDGGSAELSVFSVTGGLVGTVEFPSVAGGEATLAYPGASELASGTYFYRFTQGGRVETGSFAVVR
ncbi:MAG: hypothetical protein AVO35_11675 [Candidatus Aegiribacteria sp. MLS_C]|nr:MAG: hypothetical protein AVO35_11675 [Candidatus Aegiribacteria sp. MLS_C]